MLATLSPSDIDAALSDPQARAYMSVLKAGMYNFTPRPDRPELYDEQSGFLNSTAMVSIARGGTGSGKTHTAAQKCAEFVCFKQAPPRHDTPFWILSNTYEQTIEICWKEKLSQIIPAHVIDWERIGWHDLKAQWPSRVPLKPWPSTPGRNWVLEFKSLDQGRENLQGRSIGGFWFSEQFPYDVFVEVLGRTRDTWFPGGQFCEFTPKNPDLASAFEAAEEDPPPGWKFFRLNMECNTAINAEWKDSHLKSVSAEMLETIRTGAYASYQGAIYQTFNPKIHVLNDDQWEQACGTRLPDRKAIPDGLSPDGELRWALRSFPPNVWHRRGIDWGESREHPFACVWGFRDGGGDWFIYDEYYDPNGLLYGERIDSIKARWPWPEGSMQHGQTYADPSRPGLINEFNSQGIPTGSASNSIDNGIECVRRLLKINPSTKRPKIFFHEKNCPNLIKEMKKYRWRPTSENEKTGVAKREPLRRWNDACFPAGQPVNTPSGMRPIETIKRGDRIVSHLGIATADTDSVCVGIDEVIRVVLSDGRYILCTATHQLATADGGWVDAGKSLGVELCVAKEFGESEPAVGNLPSDANMADTSGLVTQNQRHSPTPIFGECRRSRVSRSGHTGFTSKYGETTTVKFQKEWRFTTGTKTKRTMLRKIFSYLPPATTQSCISPISERRSLPLRNGMAAARGVNGIPNTVKERGMIGSSAQSSVSIAERTSRRGTQEARRDSVQTIAGLMQGKNPALITSNSLANSAERSSAKTAIQRRRLAPVNVDAVSVGSVESVSPASSVWCFASSDGTFFVNGVLVSNCDALRYLVFSESQWGDLKPSSGVRERRSEMYGVKGGSR